MFQIASAGAHILVAMDVVGRAGELLRERISVCCRIRRGQISDSSIYTSCVSRMLLCQSRMVLCQLLSLHHERLYHLSSAGWLESMRDNRLRVMREYGHRQPLLRVVWYGLRAMHQQRDIGRLLLRKLVRVVHREAAVISDAETRWRLGCSEWRKGKVKWRS